MFYIDLRKPPEPSRKGDQGPGKSRNLAFLETALIAMRSRLTVLGETPERSRLSH
jgi:hypothetical protein